MVDKAKLIDAIVIAGVVVYVLGGLLIYTGIEKPRWIVEGFVSDHIVLNPIGAHFMVNNRTIRGELIIMPCDNISDIYIVHDGKKTPLYPLLKSLGYPYALPRSFFLTPYGATTKSPTVRLTHRVWYGFLVAGIGAVMFSSGLFKKDDKVEISSYELPHVVLVVILMMFLMWFIFEMLYSPS